MHRSVQEMKQTDLDNVNLPEEVPKGFFLEPRGQGAFIIRHTRTGMGCMNVFLIVWLIGWTVGCVFLLRQYLGGGTMEDGNSIPLWFVLVFWGAEIGVACLLLNLLFRKRSFLIDREALIIQTDVLGFRRHQSIPRHSIKKLIQMKDGGEDEDSFPSWGLKLEVDKKTSLIYRQPHEKSRWLGQVLAQWAGVEFTEVPKE